MIDPSHPLMEGARYVDARAEESGLDDACLRTGMDLDVLLHVAQQRAMRLVLLRHRGADGFREIVRAAKPQEVLLTSEELADITLLKLAYMDGLFIGWFSSQIDARTRTDQL